MYMETEKGKAMKTTAIVLAAGQGKRMNSKVAKQYLMIADKPVLYYSLQAFQNSFVDEIVLVTGRDEIEYCQKGIVEHYGFNKVVRIVAGGKERYHSVWEGLRHTENADYIFIHDGARPFIDERILQDALNCVQENKACVVAMPVKDTIKIVDEQQFVKETPNRNLVWMMQTPQVFEGSLIKEAYRMLIEQEAQLLEKGINITDDAMVVETCRKHPVKLVKGSYRNIKITTPEDLEIAEILVKSRD